MSLIDSLKTLLPVRAPAQTPASPSPAPASPGVGDQWWKDSFVTTTNAAKAAAPAQGPVDQNHVDEALRMINDPASAARVLSSPVLTPAERDEVVRRLAEDPNKRIFLLGDATTSTDDLKFLGDAIAHAVQNGALSTSDIYSLADADGSGMGASRLMQQMMLDPANLQVGGPCEAVAKQLQARANSGQSPNADRDRFAADLCFTATPELLNANLTTPGARVDAFKTLVNGMDGAVPDGLKAGNPDVGQQYQAAILTGAARLYVQDGAEIVDRLTQDGNFQGTPLAKFFNATLFSPDAQTLDYDHRRTLTDAIKGTTQQILGNMMSGLDGLSPADREAKARQIGRLAATIGGGAQLALKQWQTQLQNNQAYRDTFAELLGAVLSPIAPDVPFKDQILSAITKGISKSAITDPSQPDTSLALTIHNAFEGALRKYEQQHPDQPVVTSFDAGYSDERWQLQDELRILLSDGQ